VINKKLPSLPVVLAAHLLREQLEFGRDFVLVASLNERHFATAAEQIPRHLTEPSTYIKYSLDFVRTIITAEAFEAVDWLADLPQQTWPQGSRPVE